MVKKDRFLERLFAVGDIGADENGVSRVAFSETFFSGAELVKKFMIDEGMEVSVDKAGNVVGVRKGNNPEKPVIIIGSHLDTVKNGGIYDGNLGVAAGLECISILNDRKIETVSDIVIVGFNGEEGSALGGTFGSRSFLGCFDFDRSGLEEGLSSCRISKADILSCRFHRKMKAFLELHIEQGQNLYAEGVPIGVVSGIVGIEEYKIEITGCQNHAGTTGMKYRKDALVAGAKLIDFINQEALKIPEPFVATVGKLEVFPNMTNVISGKVEFILELRDMNKGIMDDFVVKLEEKIKKLDEYNITIEPFDSNKSVFLDSKISNLTEVVCKDKNIDYKVMYSGAGHDAMEFAQFVDTGMIFIPSKDGISHSKREFSYEDDIVRGTEVLFGVLTEIDKL